MARTYLSILTNDTWLQEKLISTFKQSDFSIGFSGSDEVQLLSYFEKHILANHVLFVKPCRQTKYAYDENYLRSLFKIDVIVIGPALLTEHKGLIHNSQISGYITTDEIDYKTINTIVTQLYHIGYYANTQIPRAYWESTPKPVQKFSAPKFTKREKSIINLLCHGFNQVEISQIIHTSVSNVRNHLDRIKSKTMVETSTQLAIVCISNRWVVLTREKFKRHNPYIISPLT